MNIEQAKKIDLVDYLASLGLHPSRIRREDHWYPSPLRGEKTPSFKIDRKQNVWYDHGLGKGGNFIDFAILYHNCSVKELLTRLDNNLSFHPQAKISTPILPQEPLIKIITEKSLSSLALLRYLKQRRIAENVARDHCREITFSLNEKRHLAIGFKNNEGGYELRSAWFKGSCSPKGVTSIDNGSREMVVFEGFFNYLSYLSINQNQRVLKENFLILNSTAFFEKSRGLMERHDAVRLYLDNDKGGERCVRMGLSWGSKYRDESGLYKGYNDLNEWQQQIGKSQRRGTRQSL